jgi:hypothetical protein
VADLEAAQAELVAALTGVGPVPVGFDAGRLEIARKALLRKRSGEIARTWPLLASSLGDRFLPRFAEFAVHRPTSGSWRDGWDFARQLAATSALPADARLELAERELVWRYDGIRPPRRRRWPAVTAVNGRVLVQVGGRIRELGGRAGR